MALKIIGIALLVVVIIYAVSLVVLFTQLSRYKNYWNDNNRSAAQPNEILYVALGDSTAQGIGATNIAFGRAGGTNSLGR